MMSIKIFIPMLVLFLMISALGLILGQLVFDLNERMFVGWVTGIVATWVYLDLVRALEK